MISEIIELLAWYESRVRLSGKLHLFDTHQKAENFFRDLLNLMYDWGLQNANYTDLNAKAIDLISDKANLSIQITSDNSKSKIDNTVEGFFDPNTGYSNKYNKLIVLVFGEKNSNSKKYEDDHSQANTTLFYNFTLQLWDIHTLNREINNYTLAEQKKIFEFLEQYISPMIQKVRRIECNEVETIKRLIDFLSNTELETDIKSDIDPESKIEKRFSDYSNELKAEYKDLYGTYGQALDESKKGSNLDALKSKKVAQYLKRLSDNILNENDGNPKKALDALTSFFQEKISEGFINYDEGAIRFYLVDQLIRCNVFPMKI
ncbi:MAG: hypothetical protein EAZ95_04575 [Bacteroidetes bacterium]|nr:MAG: hypothetical protein EAZ95_04575 [Bacteroidota bacterium]